MWIFQQFKKYFNIFGSIFQRGPNIETDVVGTLSFVSVRAEQSPVNILRGLNFESYRLVVFRLYEKFLSI